MAQNQSEKQKRVRMIPATKNSAGNALNQQKLLRVAAYCRVSTKQEEQLNSYEVQTRYYTDKVNSEPTWVLAGIFADKGITGTSVKKRDEFNKMIRLCKRGKIDMIITKSISRFARNTVDCLEHTRMLKELGVDVFFEEQGIHSIQQGSEFYITIYGSIAQSESENISANVKWGKEQSAKEGNVPFSCKNFLGYSKDEAGNIVIVPDEAEVIRDIYRMFLSGDSVMNIKQALEAKSILTPRGKAVWSQSTIISILTNEKYKGDAIINKTYTTDCLSKKVKVNNGERPKYYIENNPPAIIDAITFGRVQEEIARRNAKRKVKQIGTSTELGKYSGKYALTERLVCGECGTPYRRCTWTASGVKRIVWRCINRLDYGKKYCHHSPTLDEADLHEAIMEAIQEAAQSNAELLQVLKLHIGMAIGAAETEDRSLDIQIRIAEIDTEFKKILDMVSADTTDGIDENHIAELMEEKQRLQQQLDEYSTMEGEREQTQSRFDEICTVVDTMKNHPIAYDDKLVRRVVEKVTVLSDYEIRVRLMGGIDKLCMITNHDLKSSRNKSYTLMQSQEIC